MNRSQANTDAAQSLIFLKKWKDWKGYNCLFFGANLFLGLFNFTVALMNVAYCE